MYDSMMYFQNMNELLPQKSTEDKDFVLLFASQLSGFFHFVVYLPRFGSCVMVEIHSTIYFSL